MDMNQAISALTKGTHRSWNQKRLDLVLDEMVLQFGVMLQEKWDPSHRPLPSSAHTLGHWLYKLIKCQLPQDELVDEDEERVDIGCGGVTAEISCPTCGLCDMRLDMDANSKPDEYGFPLVGKKCGHRSRVHIEQRKTDGDEVEVIVYARPEEL